MAQYDTRATNPLFQKSTTIQPFMPGQQGLLAQQLNSGFGGGPNHWQGILGQYYTPMQSTPQFLYGQQYDDALAAKKKILADENKGTGGGDNADKNKNRGNNKPTFLGTYNSMYGFHR